MRVQCTPSSSLSSSSHSRPHPLELHTFMYPLSSGRSVQSLTRIKRVFKLRALHTLKYLTTYFLLCGRLATAICPLRKINKRLSFAYIYKFKTPSQTIDFNAGVKGEEKKKSDYSRHCHLVSWYSGSISRMCLIMKLLINTKQVRQEKQTSDTLTLLNDTDTVCV